MNKRVIEIPMGDGTVAAIEVNDDRDTSPQTMRGVRDAMASAVVERVEQTFESALARVKPAASAVMEQLSTLTHVPDNIEVEFGIKFGAKGNAYLAAADAEANFKVTLKWQREKPAATTPSTH
jgi:hypothetical protein